MAADHVQLDTRSAVGRRVAPDTEHRVTMRQPFLAGGRIARHRPAVDEADLRRVDIPVLQWVKCRRALQRAKELWRRGANSRTGIALAVRIAPLHHVVVLHADDVQAVEVVRSYQ